MCSEVIAKIELPIAPSIETMKLLIKAKHFLNHAQQHAYSGNDFDTMISIHSLDNTIEYLLRIIIKHLEIEEKISKTLSTPELMALFGEVDKFLKERASYQGKGVVLPFEAEIRQLRTLRNNVQHGLILPVSELHDFLKYGVRFLEKVLEKIFGLTIQQISYSTLVENEGIKNHLIKAENKISDGKYLEAIVACRDAFELGRFLLQNQSNHVSKMAAIPHIKKESMELYYYIQGIDDELSVLGTNINISEYRTYSRYVDHIPSEYRAIKSGYSVMQREWIKDDADFCYSFVAQSILTWQLLQEKPLYEVDLSGYAVHVNDFSIDGVLIPEIYGTKTCRYLNDDDEGFLFFVNDKEIKEHLQKNSPGDTCYFHTKIKNKESGAMFREYAEYAIINSRDFNLVLNDGPLWEIMLYYKVIPFTTTSDLEGGFDIDNISDYQPSNENEEKGKDIIINFGEVDSVEKAFELNQLLITNQIDPFFFDRMFSSKLLNALKK